MARVAIAGYCQTGRHPLVYAAQAKIQAVIVWYGAASKREWDANPRQPEPLDDLIARIDCPVFAAFGAEDHIISIDDVRRFRNALEQHRKSYHIAVYAGAPHGWQADAPASAAPTALSSPPSIATTRREDYFHNFFTHMTTEEGRGPPGGRGSRKS
jgi:dienelactone hydrolase